MQLTDNRHVNNIVRRCSIRLLSARKTIFYWFTFICPVVFPIPGSPSINTVLGFRRIPCSWQITDMLTILSVAVPFVFSQRGKQYSTGSLLFVQWSFPSQDLLQLTLFLNSGVFRAVKRHVMSTFFSSPTEAKIKFPFTQRNQRKECKASFTGVVQSANVVIMLSTGKTIWKFKA